MKKNFLRFLVVLFMLPFQLVTAAPTVLTIPVTFHVYGDPNDPVWAANASDQQLANLICAVNKIYAGQDPDLIAGYSSLPPAFQSMISDTRIRFYIAAIDRPETSPAQGSYWGSVQLTPPAFPDGSKDLQSFNIYLYQYSDGPSSASDAVFLAPAGGTTMTDVIFLKKSGLNKTILAHELGHSLDLCHTDGCGAGGTPITQRCSMGNSCCTGLPSGLAFTPPCMSAGSTTTSMPQNIMFPGTGSSTCRTFFIPCQTDAMRNLITTTWWRSYSPPNVLTIGALTGPIEDVPLYIDIDDHQHSLNVIYPDCLAPGVIADISYEIYQPCSPTDVLMTSGNLPAGTTTFNWASLMNPPISLLSPACVYYIKLTTTYTSGYTTIFKYYINTTNGSTTNCPCGSGGENGKQGTTSVKTTDIKTPIVYPNPAKDMLMVSSSYKFEAYKIYDMTGRLLLKGDNNNNNAIDIKTLAKGIYVMKLQTGTIIKAVNFSKD